MFDILETWAAHGVLGYAAVALGAATPWVELLVVIPPAIALGLDPLVVAVVAFVGNFLPVAGIAAAYEAWTARRGADADATAAGGRRARRARRLFHRFGVAGLTVLGPATTGIHLAAVIALALRAPRAQVVAWSAGSLAAWSVVVVAATTVGIDALGG